MLTVRYRARVDHQVSLPVKFSGSNESTVTTPHAGSSGFPAEVLLPSA